MMKTLGLILPAVVLLALLIACAGCRSGGKSAETVARTYVGLMANGKYEEAAKLWDYETQARRDNEDWDSIQEGQRTLIIDKLAAEKATTLKLWSGYFTGAKVLEVQESGETAVAQLDGGRAKRVELVRMGEHWKVSGME